MKKALKKMTISLMSGLMLCSSTYAVEGSVNAANSEAQPKGSWYVYGDVNNDGIIDSLDLVSVNQAIKIFKDMTGSSSLPLEYAIARPQVYSLIVPQAADIDGDGYITNNDSKLLMYYIAESYEETGRCGHHFYLN